MAVSDKKIDEREQKIPDADQIAHPGCEECLNP
jgi:hypothetical protein